MSNDFSRPCPPHAARRPVRVPSAAQPACLRRRHFALHWPSPLRASQKGYRDCVRVCVLLRARAYVRRAACIPAEARILTLCAHAFPACGSAVIVVDTACGTALLRGANLYAVCRIAVVLSMACIAAHQHSQSSLTCNSHSPILNQAGVLGATPGSMCSIRLFASTAWVQSAVCATPASQRLTSSKSSVQTPSLVCSPSRQRRLCRGGCRGQVPARGQELLRYA